MAVATMENTFSRRITKPVWRASRHRIKRLFFSFPLSWKKSRKGGQIYSSCIWYIMPEKARDSRAKFSEETEGEEGDVSCCTFSTFSALRVRAWNRAEKGPAVLSVGQTFSRLLEITKLLKRERKFFCSREEKELDKSTVLLLISLYISNISMCSLNF